LQLLNIKILILFAEIMQVCVYKNHYTDIKEIIQTTNEID
jgi:hypothetical protein